jgi:hypothetical protein
MDDLASLLRISNSVILRRFETIIRNIAREDLSDYNGYWATWEWFGKVGQLLSFDAQRRSPLSRHSLRPARSTLA